VKKGTRRRFLRQTGLGILATSAVEQVSAAPQAAIAVPASATPLQVVSALGDTLIPTEEPQYPGYRRLESFNISTYVWNQLRVVDRVTPQNLVLFNESSKVAMDKTFLELDSAERARHVDRLFAETDGDTAAHKVLRQARERIFGVFYRNFPYHTIDRDAKGTPIASDKLHQIINPQKTDLITGWNIAGYRGPLSWAEEEDRRARFKKIHWHEGDPG
jgi:hypothetical protein